MLLFWSSICAVYIFSLTKLFVTHIFTTSTSFSSRKNIERFKATTDEEVYIQTHTFKVQMCLMVGGLSVMFVWLQVHKHLQDPKKRQQKKTRQQKKRRRRVHTKKQKDPSYWLMSLTIHIDTIVSHTTIILKKITLIETFLIHNFFNTIL